MKDEVIPICKHSGMVYSSHHKGEWVSEQFLEEHGLCYISSGVLSVFDKGETKNYSSGEIVFFRKNFLAKFRKLPTGLHNYKSITVIFDSKMLKSFSTKYNIAQIKLTNGDAAVSLLSGELSLMHLYFTSLSKYFEVTLPDELVELKIEEALMLLLRVMPDCKNILFDFGNPGKINLESFMQQNFRFNVDLKKLAVLTGRSMASFKRDFEKIFKTTPNRWLQKRRLEEAYVQISENNRRPTDVYHEVGFETIAHFSYAFKQHFGVNPSHINNHTSA
jgi:AraC-like DNA-binding protein